MLREGLPQTKGRHYNKILKAMFTLPAHDTLAVKKKKGGRFIPKTDSQK